MMRQRGPLHGSRIAARMLALVPPVLFGCTEQPRHAGPSAITVAKEIDPLVTGRAIEPKFDAAQDVGSIPINMMLSPDGRYAICTDQGFRQFLSCIRTDNGTAVSHVEYSRSALNGKNGLYYGVAIERTP